MKIAPSYERPTIHVLDASRSVGVVEQLLNPKSREQFDKRNRAEQAQLVEVVSAAAASPPGLVRGRAAATVRDRLGEECGSTRRRSWACACLQDVPLAELVPFIDWSPFFQAWELRGKYPKIFDDPTVGMAARELFDDAQQLLHRIVEEHLLVARGVYGFWPAASWGDDIVVYASEQRDREIARFHTLRQQWDAKGKRRFTPSQISSRRSKAVARITSARLPSRPGWERTNWCGDSRRSTTTTARFWSNRWPTVWPRPLPRCCTSVPAAIGAMAARRAFGRRTDRREISRHPPGPWLSGLPRPHRESAPCSICCPPSATRQMTLTENFAMYPAASVSGLYFAHPEARYFAVDRITREQAEDYARRKGMTLAEVERWLAPNLGYEPS